MTWNPAQAYNDLPPLPPAKELETVRVLKQCIKSRTALANLNQAAGFLPNRSLLINILPLLEAKASSEIENIVTTTDSLFKSSLTGTTFDPATKEAMNYRHALYAGYRSLETTPLCTNTAEQICSEIKHCEMKIRQVPGTTLRNDLTGETIYTPPVGEDLLHEKLANWERFIHDTDSDLDPLVVMAVSHYQFEAIHPFTDGNGRTGRIINLLYLISAGLLDTPILYHSRSIIKRKAEYYKNLNRVTSAGDWQSWILYILETVEDAALWTNHKISEIRNLKRSTKAWLKENASKIYSAELLDVLFSQPYCRIQDLVDAGVAKRQAASTYLHSLIELGILEEEKVGREKLFVHKNFLALLLNESDVPTQ